MVTLKEEFLTAMEALNLNIKEVCEFLGVGEATLSCVMTYAGEQSLDGGLIPDSYSVNEMKHWIKELKAAGTSCCVLPENA